MSDDYECPGCAAYHLYERCYHTPQQWAMAEAIRDAVTAAFPESKPGWEDDLQGAWGFIEDGDLANDPVIGAPPYSVKMIAYNVGRWTALGLIDGEHLFGIQNAEGDVPAEYLCNINEDLPLEARA